MQILFLIITSLVCFGSFILAYHYYKSSGLYVYAIGGIIAANFYNIGTYPIQIGNFIFGIDSVVYSLFVFCAMVILFDYGERQLKELTYSSAAAIIFSGAIQFVSAWASFGLGTDIVWGFVSFVISAIATIIPVIASIFIYRKIKNKLNPYLILILLMIFIAVINSVIYFGFIACFGALPDSYLMVIVASYIGKAIALVFAIGAYFVCNIWKKKVKYPIKKEK